jgi:hypothetical protein
MKRTTKILSIVLLASLSIYILLVAYLNQNHGSKIINGIEVSELLLLHTRNKDIDYCKILSNATNGDEKSIKELLQLEVYDGAGYDHGVVIIDLINLLGETKIINAVKTMDCKHKSAIISYINAGLQYGNNTNLKAFESHKAFPLLHASLECL